MHITWVKTLNHVVNIQKSDKLRMKSKIFKQSAPVWQRYEYAPEDLNGKNIIVTGGTKGIGRTTALLLASKGANLLIFGRHGMELDDTLEEFHKAGMENLVHGLTADSSGQEGIQKVFEEADRLFDRLDILINNAAIGYGGIMEGDYKDWQYVINTNLLGYMACAHEAIKRMKKYGGGHIINIGSMSPDLREKDNSVYVATKSGIQGFSEALRKEVNEFGIKVTLIEPGDVGTGMQPISPKEQRKKENHLQMLRAEDIADCILYTILQPKRCDVVQVQIRPHL